MDGYIKGWMGGYVERDIGSENIDSHLFLSIDLNNRRLVSRIYKESLQLNNEKTNNEIFSIAQYLKTVHKRKGMTNTHICLTSLVSIKIQVKTTTRCHYPSQ